MKRFLTLLLLLTMFINTNLVITSANDIEGAIPKYPNLFETAKDYPLGVKIRDVKKPSENIYYKIKTTSNDSFYYFRSRTNSINDYLKFELLDETGCNVIASFSTDVNEGKLFIKLKPSSTYYLVAYENKKDITKYILHIKELKDDFPDDLNSAINSKAVSLNQVQARNLQAANDVDFIKFTTSNKQDYQIHLTINKYYMEITLYDENGTVVDSRSSASSHLYIIRKLKPNSTYYLKVDYYYDYSKGFYDNYFDKDTEYDFSIIESDSCKLDPASIKLNKGKSFKLQLSSKIDSNSILYTYWYSENNNVAKTDFTFDNKKSMSTTITAYNKGTAKINCRVTLKDNSQIYATCLVTVP